MKKPGQNRPKSGGIFISEAERHQLLYGNTLMELRRTGLFLGELADYAALPNEKKDELLERLKSVLEQEKIRSEYELSVELELYSGSFESYCALPELEKMALGLKMKTFLNKMEVFVKRLNKEELFDGKLTDYLNLSRNERDKLECRICISDYKDALVNVDSLFNKLQSCSDRAQYFSLLEQLESAISSVSKCFKRCENFKKKFTEAQIDIPDELKKVCLLNINFPKIMFWDGKRYGILNDVLNLAFLTRVINREIFSCFSNDTDFSKKDVWKKFLDDKEQEYRDFVNKGVYSGTFEEYLQESSITRFELFGRFKFGDSVRKPQSGGVIPSSNGFPDYDAIQREHSDERARIMDAAYNPELTALAAGLIAEQGASPEKVSYGFKPGNIADLSPVGSLGDNLTSYSREGDGLTGGGKGPKR